MSDLQVLHRGGHSQLAKRLQQATNERLEQRGLGWAKVAVDGDIGTKTLAAVKLAARYLGAKSSTYDAITRKGEIPIGVSRMILNPNARTQVQLDRAAVRMSHLRAQRKRRHQQPKTGARARTVNAFLAHLGTHEIPGGSNSDRGGLIDQMERFWGFHGVAWCGISAGYHAVKYGGMQGLHSDVASVAAIENHARSGHAPYKAWIHSRDALPGAFLPVGRFGQHVVVKVDNLDNGRVRTVAGNHNDRIAVVDYATDMIRGAAAMDY